MCQLCWPPRAVRLDPTAGRPAPTLGRSRLTVKVRNKNAVQSLFERRESAAYVPTYTLYYTRIGGTPIPLS